MDVEKVIQIKDGEKVVRIVRHYWLVYIPAALIAFLCIALPFFFLLPLFSWNWIGAAIFGISIFVGVLYALRLAILWHWNAFIITTHRVVDIDRRGFFDRIVSEAPYDKIQHVSYRIQGLFGTLGRYGTVVIQNAGMTTTLELPHVYDPRSVHHLLTEMIDYNQRRHGRQIKPRTQEFLVDES